MIRAGNRSATYRALGSSLAPGGDVAIKAIQDRLVALGYLDARHADGLIGRSRSATLDAVEAFQRANRLKVDRDLGGPNSETRQKLARPIEQLVSAPVTALRPAWVLGAVALLLTACQPDSAGPLVPIEGTGGAPVVKGGGPSTTLRSGAVTVTLSGQWASEGEQTLDIRYINHGTMVVRLDPRDIRLRRGADPIDTLSILDMTASTLPTRAATMTRPAC